jgi:hypothetical protein
LTYNLLTGDGAANRAQTQLSPIWQVGRARWV